MLGAIIGDIVGSPFEFDRRKGLAQTHFPLYLGDADYTDDSLMTIAVADALMEIDGDETRADRVLATRMRAYAYAYPLPRGGFGGRFRQWLADPDMGPYGSWGNGAAMRVSPAGWLYPTLEQTEHWAEITARVSHDHPEGLKGARVTAGCIFLSGARYHTLAP
jgi:ADP-ribosylglycohydrolase